MSSHMSTYDYTSVARVFTRLYARFHTHLYTRVYTLAWAGKGGGGAAGSVAGLREARGAAAAAGPSGGAARRGTVILSLLLAEIFFKDASGRKRVHILKRFRESPVAHGGICFQEVNSSRYL